MLHSWQEVQGYEEYTQTADAAAYHCLKTPFLLQVWSYIAFLSAQCTSTTKMNTMLQSVVILQNYQ